MLSTNLPAPPEGIEIPKGFTESLEVRAPPGRNALSARAPHQPSGTARGDRNPPGVHRRPGGVCYAQHQPLGTARGDRNPQGVHREPGGASSIWTGTSCRGKLRHTSWSLAGVAAHSPWGKLRHTRCNLRNGPDRRRCARAIRDTARRVSPARTWPESEPTWGQRPWLPRWYGNPIPRAPTNA